MFYLLIAFVLLNISSLLSGEAPPDLPQYNSSRGTPIPMMLSEEEALSALEEESDEEAEFQKETTATYLCSKIQNAIQTTETATVASKVLEQQEQIKKQLKETNPEIDWDSSLELDQFIRDQLLKKYKLVIASELTNKAPVALTEFSEDQKIAEQEREKAKEAQINSIRSRYQSPKLPYEELVTIDYKPLVGWANTSIAYQFLLTKAEGARTAHNLTPFYLAQQQANAQEALWKARVLTAQTQHKEITTIHSTEGLTVEETSLLESNWNIVITAYKEALEKLQKIDIKQLSLPATIIQELISEKEYAENQKVLYHNNLSSLKNLPSISLVFKKTSLQSVLKKLKKEKNIQDQSARFIIWSKEGQQAYRYFPLPEELPGTTIEQFCENQTLIPIFPERSNAEWAALGNNLLREIKKEHIANTLKETRPLILPESTPSQEKEVPNQSSADHFHITPEEAAITAIMAESSNPTELNKKRWAARFIADQWIGKVAEINTRYKALQEIKNKKPEEQIDPDSEDLDISDQSTLWDRASSAMGWKPKLSDKSTQRVRDLDNKITKEANQSTAWDNFTIALGWKPKVSVVGSHIGDSSPKLDNLPPLVHSSEESLLLSLSIPDQPTKKDLEQFKKKRDDAEALWKALVIDAPFFPEKRNAWFQSDEKALKQQKEQATENKIIQLANSLKKSFERNTPRWKAWQDTHALASEAEQLEKIEQELEKEKDDLLIQESEINVQVTRAGRSPQGMANLKAIEAKLREAETRTSEAKTKAYKAREKATAAYNRWMELAQNDKTIIKASSQGEDAAKRAITRLEENDQAVNRLWIEVKALYEEKKMTNLPPLEVADEENSSKEYESVLEGYQESFEKMIDGDLNIRIARANELATQQDTPTKTRGVELYKQIEQDEKQIFLNFQMALQKEALWAAREKIPKAQEVLAKRLTDSQAKAKTTAKNLSSSKRIILNEWKCELKQKYKIASAITTAYSEALRYFQEEQQRLADIETLWMSIIESKKKELLLKRGNAAKDYYRGNTEPWSLLSLESQLDYNKEIIKTNDENDTLWKQRIDSLIEFKASITTTENTTRSLQDVEHELATLYSEKKEQEEAIAWAKKTPEERIAHIMIDFESRTAAAQDAFAIIKNQTSQSPNNSLLWEQAASTWQESIDYWTQATTTLKMGQYKPALFKKEVAEEFEQAARLYEQSLSQALLQEKIKAESKKYLKDAGDSALKLAKVKAELIAWEEKRVNMPKSAMNEVVTTWQEAITAAEQACHFYKQSTSQFAQGNFDGPSGGYMLQYVGNSALKLAQTKAECCQWKEKEANAIAKGNTKSILIWQEAIQKAQEAAWLYQKSSRQFSLGKENGMDGGWELNRNAGIALKSAQEKAKSAESL